MIEIISYTTDGMSRSPRYIYEEEGHGWENWIINGTVIGVINPETVNYFGYKDNIKGILMQNNINCTVNDYMVIRLSYDIPSIIWVDTNIGNYYITFENVYSENTKTFDYGWHNNFVYKVYDAKSFVNVLSYKDADIIVDDEKISNQNYYSKIRGNIASISLRTALEALGSSVTWDDENQSVIFTCGEDTYMFNVLDKVAAHNRVMVSAAGSNYEPVFWSDRVRFKMIDGRIVIDHDILQYFVKLFEKNVVVDFDNLIINIK